MGNVINIIVGLCVGYWQVQKSDHPLRESLSTSRSSCSGYVQRVGTQPPSPPMVNLPLVITVKDMGNLDGV